MIYQPWIQKLLYDLTFLEKAERNFQSLTDLVAMRMGQRVMMLVCKKYAQPDVASCKAYLRKELGKF